MPCIGGVCSVRASAQRAQQVANQVPYYPGRDAGIQQPAAQPQAAPAQAQQPLQQQGQQQPVQMQQPAQQPQVQQPVAQPQAAPMQQGAQQQSMTPWDQYYNQQTPEIQAALQKAQQSVQAGPGVPPQGPNPDWPMGVQPGTVTEARWIRDLENLRRANPQHPHIKGMEDILKNRPEGFFKPGGLTTGVENTGMGAPMPHDAGWIAKASQAAGGPGNLAAILVAMLPVIGAGATGALSALFASSPAAAQEVAKAINASPEASKALQAGGQEGSSLLNKILKVAVPIAVTTGAGYVANQADKAAQDKYQQDIREGKGGLQFPMYTPQQEEVQNKAMQMGQQQMEQFYGQKPLSFDPQEQRIRENFNAYTLPSIMSRFGGLAQGRTGQRSSVLDREMRRARGDLETGLGSLRSQYDLRAGALQQQGIGQLLSTGLQPRFNTYMTPPPPSALSQFFQAAAPGVSQALTKWSLGV